MLVQSFNQVQTGGVAMHGHGRGTIVCGARRYEHTNIAKKRHYTMNLATKCTENDPLTLGEAIIKSIQHCTVQYKI